VVDRYIVDGRPIGPVVSPEKLGLAWSDLLLPNPSLCNLLRASSRILLPVRWYTELSKLKRLLGHGAGALLFWQK